MFLAAIIILSILSGCDFEVANSDSSDGSSKKSLSSILDSNITTVIAACALYFFGRRAVKGFATMLIINIIVTILVMIYLVKLILKIFVNTNLFNNKPGLFIGLNKKKITKSKEIVIPYQKLNFIKHKNKFIIIILIP
jgi:SecD/SecF fusion protein